MGAPRRRNGSAVVIVVCIGLFLVLLAVVNPLGDRLIAAGLPAPAFAVILTIAAVVLIGTPLVTAFRARTVRSHELAATQAPALEQWARGSGWQPTTWPSPDPPTILQRARLDSSRPLAVFGGRLAGRPAWTMSWEQSFSNLGSPVTDRMVSLALVVEGLPPNASFAMGKVSAVGGWRARMMPARWAGAPPLALVRIAPQLPWGLTRTMVWPGQGVPPPQEWAGIASELDALRGWLLLQDGRLEVSALLWDASVSPDRLLGLAASAIDLVGGGEPMR